MCSGGLPAPSGAVTSELHILGQAPNAMYTHEKYAWIAESGSNTVSRLNLETGVFELGFVDVGNNRGPWDVRVDAGLVFITNYTGASVTVASADTGRVETELTNLPYASAIAVTGTHLYVTNVNYDRSREDEFGPGSVTVIDRSSWEVVGQIPTHAKNPLYAEVIPGTGQLMIVSAGAIGTATFGASTGFGPRSDAAVEIWTPATDLLSPRREVFELAHTPGSRVGAPGAPLWSGRHVYFASGTAPVVFKLDFEERAWVRGVEDPIPLYSSSSNALHHATIDDRGILYVTSFNDDRMYLLDTTCDKVLGEPVELGAVPDLVEGPHGATVRRVGADETEVLFITSVSGVLGKVMFDFSQETP